MKYLEFLFSLQPCSSDAEDVLEAILADVGFDSFVKGEADGEPLKAYIRTELYDADRLAEALRDFPLPGFDIGHSHAEAEDKDWNAEWERNYFTPLDVDGRCTVAATFHKDVPRTEYNITINPRMSFGTGHHETTYQMLHELLQADLRDKDVLDMGCGTSILAILASMRGARRCTAIDVDEWCVRNSRENLELNGITNVDVLLGDATLLADREGAFDVVIANIHLNVIVHDMAAYTRSLRPGGLLLTSGFYATDLAAIRAEAERCGLRFLHAGDRRNWCCAAFTKE